MAMRFADIESRVLEFIEEGGDFESCAAQVFAYQQAHNPALRRWWREQGAGTFAGVDALPAVPTDVFRHVRLCSGERPPARVFRTSGTTSGARGAHHRFSTRCYDVGARAHFDALVRADMSPETTWRWLPLVLPADEHPDSSLSHMVADFIAHDRQRDRAVATPTPWPLRSTGLNTLSAHNALRQAALSDEPTIVFGTAFALVMLLDAMPEAVTLPAGSRVIETGGFKGKTREVERDTLYRMLTRQLGVASDRIVSEYSMTELSSQLYSDTLRRGAHEPRLIAPHWCRVSVVDPHTLAPVANGERGLIRFVDLANVETVMAVQTSDLGVLDERGLRLLGRASDALPRGCSLAVEELTEAQKP